MTSTMMKNGTRTLIKIERIYLRLLKMGLDWDSSSATCEATSPWSCLDRLDKQRDLCRMFELLSYWAEEIDPQGPNNENQIHMVIEGEEKIMQVIQHMKLTNRKVGEVKKSFSKEGSRIEFDCLHIVPGLEAGKWEAWDTEVITDTGELK